MIGNFLKNSYKSAASNKPILGKTKNAINNLFLKLSNTKILTLKPIDYLMYFLPCKVKKVKEKKKNIQHTIKYVNNRLDVLYILNKLVEVDKLKMLLLNKD